MKREKSARNLFLPYKQFGIDLFKKDNNVTYNKFNSRNNPIKLRTPLSSFRQRTKTKKESLFDVEKKLKKMTLSNKAFFNYMDKYTKLTQNFTFKNPNLSLYPKKKNPKYLPIFYLQKIGYKNIEEENENDNEKTNNDNNFVSFNNNLKLKEYQNQAENLKKNEENNKGIDDNDEDNVIKEKPYGFKYKDTRIVYDKSKVRVRSSLFKGNHSEFNLTNITPNINYKKKVNFNIHKNYEVKKKNKVFRYFSEGEFLRNESSHPIFNNSHINTKNKKNNMVINDFDVNNNIQMLYDLIKNIKNISSLTTMKTMKYNIKNYYKKQDFSFQVDIESLCLKFINQDINEDENKEKNKSQKLYLPFEYLPVFYLLDYTSFKVFLSEIIYYNRQTNLMEINKSEIVSILNKYKKFITLNVFNQDPAKRKKMEKITYYCKENHFQNIYDWIIYINEENNNNMEGDVEIIDNNEQNEDFNRNIIYKVKIILPIIKFHILNKKIKIKKYLNKNLLIKLIKNNFMKWEENVLCELFMNKKFRNIMNSTIASSKTIFSFSLITKKIFIDRAENNDNLLNKTKYEFFITNSHKDFSHFLYFSPYSILILYGKNKTKNIFTNIHLTLKESINLQKYSKYWGYIDTLNKCLQIHNQKVNLDLRILEKDPKKFFYLKKKDKNKSVMKENIKDFEKLGYLRYKNNENLEMSLLNCSIVEIQITTTKMDKRFYKVPKELLEIFLTENEKNNLNLHISEYSEFILFNDEILNIRREEIDLRRKAFQNDGTVKLDEDFQTEKHKTIFSFKNMNKLNSFRINPQNRYSNNPAMNKSIGSGITFFSGDGNQIKRSETNDKINLVSLGINVKNYDQMCQSQKLNRKFVKKYTVYHSKRESNFSKKNNQEFTRSPHKNNTNVMEKEKEPE